MRPISINFCPAHTVFVGEWRIAPSYVSCIGEEEGLSNISLLEDDPIMGSGIENTGTSLVLENAWLFFILLDETCPKGVLSYVLKLAGDKSSSLTEQVFF